MGWTNPKIFDFSTNDFPEQTRVGTFLEMYGGTILKHDLEPIGEQPFQFHARLCSISGLGLSAATISPCIMPRGPQHIDNDDLVLNMTLIGGRNVRQVGREASVRAGEAILTTSADVGVVTIPTMSRMISVRIPRNALQPAIADIDASLLRPITADTPALRLLDGYIAAVQRTQALAAPELQEPTVTHIQDLVALTLGATRDAAEIAHGRGVRAARLRAIKDEIVERLGSNDLSVAEVAARHGISRRYVHTLFEDEGTSFAEFVLDRRLGLAFRMLRDPRRAGQTISTIAFECGFVNLSHFSRAFRVRFGATPSDIHEAARRGDG